MINKFDKDDSMFLILSVVVPLILWWFYTGKRKYSAKGMK
jgi:hypothetical protein